MTTLIADFFEGAHRVTRGLLRFARDHFGTVGAGAETFDVDTATMEAEILDIMELKAALEAWRGYSRYEA